MKKVFGFSRKKEDQDESEVVAHEEGEGATGGERKTKFADTPPSPSTKKSDGKKHVGVKFDDGDGKRPKKTDSKKETRPQAPPSVRLMCVCASVWEGVVVYMIRMQLQQVCICVIFQDIKKKIKDCKDEKSTILDLSKCDVSQYYV